MNDSSANGSGLGRPRTRGEWDEYYEEFNQEKKRKKNQLSESDSQKDNSVMEKEKKNQSSGSEDSEGEVEVVMKEKKKGKEKIGEEGIEFLYDSLKGEKVKEKGKSFLIEKEKKKPIELSDGEVEKMPSPKKNRAVKKAKDKMGRSDEGIEFLYDSIKGEKGKGKEKTKGKESSGKKSSDSDEGSDDDIEFIGETNPNYGLGQMGNKKIISVRGDIKGGEKCSNVDEEKCSNADEVSDDEVEFLGDTNIYPFGLKTTSGSGSKVGSVGGRSPGIAGIVAYDEVASSTSKRVKDSVSISEEPSINSEESESESFSSEDSDDSDEDYKVNDSSSFDVVNVLSEDGSEDVEASEVEPGSSLVDAEEGGGMLKTEKIAKIGKKKGIVSRLRSCSKSKSLEKDERQKQVIVPDAVDSDSSIDEDSEGDDHVQKDIEKGKRMGNRMNNRKLNVGEILLNTVLAKESGLTERLHLFEENAPTQLPLKFRFFDEDNTPPEKEEWEVEIDNLFADLEMGRLQTEMGFTRQSLVGNGNVDDSTACCHPGGHVRILDEQTGIICKYCSTVFLEMKHIFPAFANRSSRRPERRFFGESDRPDLSGLALDDDPTSEFTYTHSEDTVWDLVPRHIREKMYQHQREGFEFMWRHIGGDLDIKNLKEMPSNKGKGCIISHAPGTGKTGLSVVFIQSFMKLFPMCRPVVIAPRSMLLTWENEFKKWDVDIPFHNLNNPRLSGKENVAEVQGANWRILSRKSKGKSRELNRILKLFTWANGSGILGITYRLFEKLAGASATEEEDKVRRILLKYPGLLVLDEGHTPRNDESLMWRALTKVETPLRVILSGTPFQNNFNELYNTLCLVSPDFSGSSSGSSRKYVQKGKGAKDKWASITSSILNNENDRRIEELKEMISPFVHVHKGNILLEKLPGLRDALVYLKLTDLQQKLLDMMSKKNFMEQDNLMTLISVHPSLAADYFSRSEVKGFELDPRAGVKTRFVFELINLCNAHSERVIVFSRLIEPLSLIKQQLLHHFGWVENREVLYMDGKIDAKYRQDRICAFNNPETQAKVLLASTASCCEGINLIGASRIVLLDVVWNPSITRQAISRAYRLGQTKVVYVYNLISSTFEARKYECQAKKDRMSELVFSVCEERDHCRTDNLSGIIADDIILDAMVENPSLQAIFEKIVHQPKNQQVLWTDPEGSKPADQP